MTNPQPPSRPGSSLILFLSLLLIFLILFDPALTRSIGGAVGFVLAPLLGFDRRFPVVTLAASSLLMVAGSTAVRHFFTDWVKTAKTQEILRAFQRELAEARKSQNTYKLKRLTEDQDQVMKLQAELSSEQMKPMAFTLLLVVPIFAWLGSYLIHPVLFEAWGEGRGEIVLVAVNPDLVSATLLPMNSTPSTLTFLHESTVFGLSIPGREGEGTILLRNSISGEEFRTDLSPPDNRLSSHGLGSIEPGRYEVRTEGSFRVVERSHETGTLLLLLLPEGEGRPQALVVTGSPSDLEVPVRSRAFAAVVVTGNVSNEGRILLHFHPRQGGNDSQFALDPKAFSLVVDPENPTALNPTPLKAHLPWNPSSDLSGVTLLPHWVLVYSLFSIPIGSLTQRALKLWEFRHVVARPSTAKGA